MSWTTNDIPDQTGTVAVVTGANGGLGFETARALAARGAHVVMAVRDLAKAERARQAILDRDPGASLMLQSLDLASLSSVRAASAAILNRHEAIDLLVNNAGLMAVSERRTEDGFEMQFGVNHLGHFALTALLAPALVAAGAPRVVTVTSGGRLFRSDLDPDNPHLEGAYEPWRAYGRAKMANFDFAVELNLRAAAASVNLESLCANPGYAKTELQAVSYRESGGASQRFFHITVGLVGMTPAGGALPQLRAATDPAARGGQLYGPRWGSFGPPVRRRLMAAQRRSDARATLWEVSERETGIAFDVASLA